MDKTVFCYYLQIYINKNTAVMAIEKFDSSWIKTCEDCYISAPGKQVCLDYPVSYCQRRVVRLLSVTVVLTNSTGWQMKNGHCCLLLASSLNFDIEVALCVIYYEFYKAQYPTCSKHCTIKYKAIYDVLKIILIIINKTVKLTFR